MGGRSFCGFFYEKNTAVRRYKFRDAKCVQIRLQLILCRLRRMEVLASFFNIVF